MGEPETQATDEAAKDVSVEESTGSTTEGKDGSANENIQRMLDEDEAEDSLVGEFLLFLKEEKKWWLAPILVVALLLAALFAFAETGAAPFIYTLF